MANEHLTATRAWALIRDNGKLEPDETLHLDQCEACCDWFQGFHDMAKKAGFKLSMEIPKKKARGTGATD